MILLKIILIILISDLLTGTLHWLEDAYGNPDSKWLGKSIVIPNIEHHQYPRKFLKSTFFDRVKISIIIGAVLASVLLFFGILNWEIFSVILFSSMANEIHAMAHRTDKENGRFICFLQKLGLFQSRRMHGIHHSSPYNVNYCIMTNYLNPILNAIKYWEALEFIIRLFGVKPARGNANRNGY